MPVAVIWDHATALRAYRTTAARISAWWERQDVFDKPSLQRADIRQADAAIQAAFQAQDHAALSAALAAWEAAITQPKGA